MQMHAVDSSHITHIGHDPETDTLKVVYGSKGENSKTTTFLYKEVSAEDFAGLLKSESKGRYLRQMDVFSRGMKIDQEDDKK